MNSISWSTSSVRSLASRFIDPRHTMVICTAVLLASCDGSQLLEPTGDGVRASPAASISASAIAAQWEPLRIEVNFNFLTRDSHWTSTGAFVDAGVINLAGTLPRFSPGTFKLEQVVSPIVASDGSTITWTFARTFTFTSETTLISKAQWHIVSGTGRFAGIEGHGDLVGTLDLVTGELNDVFTGWVRWP